MTSKKKHIIEEPPEVYETTSKSIQISEELHPILIKLLKKSTQEADEGKLIPHVEVMKVMREKIASLK